VERPDVVPPRDRGASAAPRRRAGSVARAARVALCCVGLALSLELARLHVKVHLDPTYRSLCAISAKFNCETVATSEWSVFAGLPVAVYGILGYLAMGALAAIGLRRRAERIS